MSSRVCSPLVDTLAAQITSASEAACLISSTVMSLRKVMSGTVVILAGGTVSFSGAPSSGADRTRTSLGIHAFPVVRPRLRERLIPGRWPLAAGNTVEGHRDTG